MALDSDPWIDQSEIFSFFPTLVWKVQLKPDLSARINTTVRESLEAQNPRLAELAPGKGWQSDQRLHTLEDYADLVACIMRSAGSVLKLLKVGYEAIELTGCWINVGTRGASHAMHSHPNNFLSGVYYVQTSPGADKLNFHDPRPQASIMRPPVTELTAHNTDQVVVQVTNGTLVMFPSWLPHSVPPGESDELRISISFNLMFSSFAESLSRPMWEAGSDDSPLTDVRRTVPGLSSTDPLGLNRP